MSTRSPSKCLALAIAAMTTACQAAPANPPAPATPTRGVTAALTARPPREITLVAGTSAPPTAAPPTAAPADSTVPATPVGGCPPTAPDALGPFYTPGAPTRSAVGAGYTLTGRVLSAQGCVPVPGARIEAWMAGPDGEYTDRYRATFVSGGDGGYRFESHVPVPYGGRPPHVHLRVSAPGYATLVTQHYPDIGAVAGSFDLVLAPQ